VGGHNSHLQHHCLAKGCPPPLWWLILYFIPIVGLIVAIINTNDLAKVFGKA